MRRHKVLGKGLEQLRNDSRKETTMPSNTGRDVATLCGSTRFVKEFNEINKQLTLEGVIVLSVGCHTHSDKELQITKEQKENLDALHFDKISMSDSIFVINKDGYVGESTSREIAHAFRSNKGIRFLEYDEEKIGVVVVREVPRLDEASRSRIFGAILAAF